MKFTYNAFREGNDKYADQSARMRRLVCAFVVRNPEDMFSRVATQIIRLSFYGICGTICIF